ncbi:TolC family protein [Halosquirtibacter xylanolyticus]|uniref:TolC family protein n=1 Tax=Halosquirtibacter xylanolyticus TaxID=3374599 RepID=UPI00374A1A17|nr:TolC family protein [Prolixibacteraceae bacterium]
MKAKSLYYIGLLSILFMCFSPVKAQVKKRCSVGFLIDKKSPQNKDLYQSVRDEVQRIIGNEVTVVFDTVNILENGFSKTVASQNYQRLLNDSNVDIILSQGVLSNYILETSVAPTKPIIMIGEVMEELSSSLWDGERKKNLCYVVNPFSLKKDLLNFKDFVSFEKVGILVNPVTLNIFPIDDFIRQALGDTDIPYEIISVGSNVEEYQKKLEGFNAVYLLIGEEFTKSEQKELVDEINRLNIRSYSSTMYDAADLGVLFSVGDTEDQDQVIRRIALNIESISNGVEASQLKSKVLSSEEINFNIKTSYAIGFNPKYSQMFRLNITGNVLEYNASEEYDLKKVLVQVVDENFKLKAEKEKIAIAKEDTKYAKSSYLPQATATASAMNLDPAIAKVLGENNKSINTSVKANVEQVIYSQEASSNIKIKKYQEKATEEEYSSQVLNMMSDCGGAYYQALIAKTNYQIADENLTLTRKNYQISVNNFEAGQSGKADVLRWKSELANATQLLINSYFTLKSSLYQLNQLLGNPIISMIDVKSVEMNKVLNKGNYFKPIFEIIDDPTQRSQVVDIISKIAIAESPELAALGYNMKSVDRTMKMYQRSKYMPTIALQGSYNYSIDQSSSEIPDHYYMLGLNVSLPLYDRNQRNIQKRKAGNQYAQIAYEQQNTQSLISQNVNTLLSEMITKASNIRLSRISSESAYESLNLMQISYSSGATSITSLIDAQKAYIKSKQDEANAATQFLNVTLSLQRYINYFFVLHSESENLEYLMNLKAKISQ